MCSDFSHLFGRSGEHLIVIRNDGLKTKFLELCARLANMYAFKWSELQRHCFPQGLVDIVSGYSYPAVRFACRNLLIKDISLLKS